MTSPDPRKEKKSTSFLFNFRDMHDIINDWDNNWACNKKIKGTLDIATCICKILKSYTAMEKNND